MMKKAFTLIELVVSIIILSLLMLFLYKSYDQLNKINDVYDIKVMQLKRLQTLKEVLYQDILEAEQDSIVIDKSDKKYDFISFISRNSLHRRIRPYITYIVHEQIFYRLESLKKIVSYPVDRDISFDVDIIGKVKRFQIYRNRSNDKNLFLIVLKNMKDEEIFLKVKALN